VFSFYGLGRSQKFAKEDVRQQRKSLVLDNILLALYSSSGISCPREVLGHLEHSLTTPQTRKLNILMPLERNNRDMDRVLCSRQSLEKKDFGLFLFTEIWPLSIIRKNIKCNHSCCIKSHIKIRLMCF
jgi:hypothetical protein